MAPDFERMADAMVPAKQVERATRAFVAHRRLRDALTVNLERLSREAERALAASIALRFAAIRQRERASIARLRVPLHEKEQS